MSFTALLCAWSNQIELLMLQTWGHCIHSGNCRIFNIRSTTVATTYIACRCLFPNISTAHPAYRASRGAARFFQSSPIRHSSQAAAVARLAQQPPPPRTSQSITRRIVARLCLPPANVSTAAAGPLLDEHGGK